MCKLIPLKLQNGAYTNVAEYKIDKLKKYLEIFPNLSNVAKVVLFGSAIETRCREDSDIDLCFVYDKKDEDGFWNDMFLLYDEIFPESASDDKVCVTSEEFREEPFVTSALYDIKTKGVVLYENTKV